MSESELEQAAQAITQQIAAALRLLEDRLLAVAPEAGASATLSELAAGL